MRVTAEVKQVAIKAISNVDADEAIKLIAQLKVALLADADANGGLGANSRHRAWRMVHELGMLLMGESKPN